jgi:hypothetical protein
VDESEGARGEEFRLESCVARVSMVVIFLIAFVSKTPKVISLHTWPIL